MEATSGLWIDSLSIQRLPLVWASGKKISCSERGNVVTQHNSRKWPWTKNELMKNFK